MSPDKKLDWFRMKGWSDAEVADVERLVVARWDQSYKAISAPATTASTADANPAIQSVRAITYVSTFSSTNVFAAPD